MKYVLMILATSVAASGLLSYSFYGSKVKAEAALVAAHASLVSLQSSIEKQEKACKIADSISVEFNQENKGIEQKKQDTLHKIDSIPKRGTISPEKGLTATPLTNVDKEANETIDIDTELPESLVRLLNEAYNNSTGQGKSDAR